VQPTLKPPESPLRKRILSGASSVFGRLGYGATRVEDIVQASGISRPTFYKVFDSKDDVFLALSARHHRTIRERLRQAYASSDDPLEQLERALESFLRWRAELGPVGRVLDLEARSPGTLLQGQRRRTLNHAVALVQAGVKRAGGQPIDPVLLRALIAGTENIADELFVTGEVSENLLQRAKALVMRLHLGVLGHAISRPGPT
jgi:AcrR family transcriptional regulator